MKKDETGNKYGLLTVIEETDKRVPSNRCIKWRCKCECGNIKIVSGHNLRQGTVRSCGCLVRKKRW
jgi:hypothetical protein